MRRVLAGFTLIVLAALLAAAAFLIEAHWEIRSLVPQLPERAALAALAGGEGGPTGLSYLNTASQRAPGGGVMVHSVFLLEWADGRVFAIDAGMNREQARAFGELIERLLGSEPIEPHGSPGEQLGAASERVRGLGFTHLHSDHTGGIASLCGTGGRAIRVFQTPWQAELENYTTRPGRDDIEAAACARPERLDGPGPLLSVPGFPGLAALPAAGHTPGSTVFLARVGGTTWVFSGDVTNRKDALLENRPKERVYSLLVVPEAPAQLERLRLWLAELDAAPDVRVVVSHDGDALAASGIPPWPGAQPPARDSR